MGQTRTKKYACTRSANEAAFALSFYDMFDARVQWNGHVALATRAYYEGNTGNFDHGTRSGTEPHEGTLGQVW